MIEETRLAEEYVDGYYVMKRAIEGIDEIQCLSVSPRTSIKRYGHDDQWEVWLRISNKTAYVCLKGGKLELINLSENDVLIMAIKGHLDYSYEDLYRIFDRLGFSVHHGALFIGKDG